MEPISIFIGTVATISAFVAIDNKRRERERAEREKAEREKAEREEAERERLYELEKRRRYEEIYYWEEQARRERRRQQQMIENLRKEKKMLEEKRKEDEAQKEKKKKIKIDEANKYYQKEKNNYENNKIKEIKNNLENTKNKFCEKQENEFSDLIKTKIRQIFTTLDSNIQKTIEENYLSNLENLKSQKDKKLRLLLIGRSGVGKSTLINSIFDYDLAETGVGRPITMHEKPKKYEYFTHSELELFDTRGIELDPNFGIEKTLKMVEEFINEQLKKKEPVNAVWYCITGNRIENVELDLVKKLQILYEKNSLPVFFVYTQCIDDLSFNKIKAYLYSELNNNIDIINILAKMKNINGLKCQKYGIKELLSITKDAIEKNKDLVLISTAKMKTEENLENILNDKNNIITYEQFDEKFEEIIRFFFKKFGIYNISQYIKNLIKIFWFEYYQKRVSIINSQLEKIAKKEAQKMRQDLSDIITKVIKKYGNILNINQDYFYYEYLTTINNKLSGLAKEIGENNIETQNEKFIREEIKKYIQTKVKNLINSF